MKLFSHENIIGIFRGFSEGGLEFHADLTLPYKSVFQKLPMHGQFLAVQLEDEREAALGRIISVESGGKLSSASGEDYAARALEENRPIPEDLRTAYLKYRVKIRMLGIVRIKDDKMIFVASHRRLPHVGSKVAFLTDEALKEIAGHNIAGAKIGHYALGEFIYADGDNRLKIEPWMRVQSPCVAPRFQVKDLVARRTFVFARAGFGKSNLVKLLFSNLYKETPTIEKRGGDAKVGTIIFDPEGEYFWPDDKGRPGLCDVPGFADKIMVFTPKAAPSNFYGSFVAGDIKPDIRRLRPEDVVSVALSSERQDQQNTQRLKGLSDTAWRDLVDLIFREGYLADGGEVKRLLKLGDGEDAQMEAARANMNRIVKMLHDPSSQMMDMLLQSLSEGKICVMDFSRMRGAQGLTLSGIILKKIFDHNQDQFTASDPKTIPVIAVLEEAQSVLSGASTSSGEGPYISWVKEGRKYDLGAVLITQQPGAISGEILSQGDNWFAFHLLSGNDLQAIKKANAHFSGDIISSLLNEPILGQGIFWSSVSGKSYPIPIRILSFEDRYKVIDKDRNMSTEKTSAAILLREQFERLVENAKGRITNIAKTPPPPPSTEPPPPEGEEKEDTLQIYEQSAIDALKSDSAYLQDLQINGKPWFDVQLQLKEKLPEAMLDAERHQFAYRCVKKAMCTIFGDNNWDTEKRPKKKDPSRFTTWIVITKNDQ